VGEERAVQILSAKEASPLTGGPSFSLADRLYRAVWGVSWVLLARWTPSPLRAWRRLLLSSFGARMGKGTDVRGGAVVWSPKNLTMHDYASIADGVHCYNMAPIELGRFVVISQRAHLCAGTHEIDDPTMQLFAKAIHISDHAWVASEAFVGPGVTMGDGAVLGARGVTARDLEPWSIYIGNPARRIKTRQNIAVARENIIKN
jgi:putative colanic acid biosynthesis acetyltransferase WcaF